MNHLCTAIRMLIAEDDALVRADLVAMAKACGHAVVAETTSGPETVAAARRLEPDAIVMDIEMPGFDGLEACRRIQSVHPVPVVIVTAHDEPAWLDSVASAGANAYLAKPVTPSDFGCAIAIALARHNDLLAVRNLTRIQECLVREVYHRVANQLGIIATLLHLQADRVPSAPGKAALLDSESRVRGMARIHALLQNARSQTTIQLGDFLSALVAELLSGLRPDITHHMTRPDPDPMVSSSIAVSCGLLVQELVMNTVRHAFPGSQPGTTWVTLERSAPHRLRLTVQDNGRGLPHDFSLENASSLGLMITSSLAKDLGGRLEVGTTLRGTRFSLDFPAGTEQECP